MLLSPWGAARPSKHRRGVPWQEQRMSQDPVRFLTVRMGVGLLLVTWCCCAVVGVGAMVAYETTPAPTRSAGNRWPTASQLVRDPQRPTLVMFVHPRCPCSRASLAELAVLASECAGRVRVCTIFVLPAGCPEGWEETGLWTAAQQIAGAAVLSDCEGIEADRFRATASGQTFLYDSAGRLLFQGGITAARGHEGASSGRAALTALIQQGFAERNHTLVFGCPLSSRSCLPVQSSNHASDSRRLQ